jgi:hypothetical protein
VLGVESIRGLIEAAVTAVSVLGGVMAWQSGFAAAQAMSQRQTPAVLTRWINEGIGEGFLWGAPLAVLAFIILLWI